jgi:hypothetical protein
MPPFSVELDVVFKPANTRFVLPTSPGYLDRVIEQSGDVNQLKLLHGRLARERLNSAHGGRSVFGCGLNDVEVTNQRGIADLAPQQLCAPEDRRQ